MLLKIDFQLDFIEVKDFTYSAVGADINAIDRRKQTPLHIAAREGEIQIVQFLCENGANFSLKDDECNYPLDLAARREKKDTTDTEEEQNREFSSVSLKLLELHLANWNTVEHLQMFTIY